jgi:hypothetical protein
LHSLEPGADPTGWGGVVAGFADQRELELLVQAGFKPEFAIRVATQNGADFLNQLEHIGSVEVGRQADLVLVRGNPAERISDVRQVETVFKDGVAYDANALVAASAGTVGEYNVRALFRWPFSLLPFALGALLARLSMKVWRARARTETRSTRRPADHAPALADADAEPGA